MSGGPYGGAPNAFMGGWEYMGFLQDQRKKENALNAMIARYGPEAANPVALGQLQGIQQRAELHPYVMADAEREKRAMDAVTGQYGPAAGSPTATGLEGTQVARRQQAASAAASVLQRTIESGGDVGAVFDRLSPILPAIGFDASQLPVLREQITANPEAAAEIIQMLQQSGAEGAVRATGNPIPVYDENGNLRLLQQMSDGTTRIVQGVTPAGAVHSEQRLAQGRKRLTLQELRQMGFDATPGFQYFMDEETGRIYADAVPGTEQDEQRQTAYANKEEAQRAALGVTQEASRRAQQGIRFAGRALDRMGIHRDSTTGEWGQTSNDAWFRSHNIATAEARRVAANRPGTDTYEIQQDFERLKGFIAIDELLAIKRGGGTLGQVTERELEMLQNMLGSWKIERDPRALRDDLVEIINMWEDITRKMQAEGERIQGQLDQPPPGRYGPPVAPPPPATPRAAPASQGTRSLDELLRQYAPQ